MIQIDTRQLTLSYNGHPVVHDLNLSAQCGELLGVIGPNGAGKTTILRALAGLMEPRTGVTLLDGQDIRRMSDASRARQIGLVSQGEQAVWALAVEEIVRLGRAPHRGWFLPYSVDDLTVVGQVLDQTNLQALRHRPLNKLSGGERQRVMIARALAQEPRLLLLDEPTANLDIHHQIQILDLIKHLVADQQIAAIIAIHDLSLAARYCDRLILLYEGRSYAEGRPQEVLTAENLKAVFGIDGQLYRDPNEQWALSVIASSIGEPSQ